MKPLLYSQKIAASRISSIFIASGIAVSAAARAPPLYTRVGLRTDLSQTIQEADNAHDLQ